MRRPCFVRRDIDPPGSQQYFDLLADIERRLENRPKGGPPIGRGALSQISEHDDGNSAILVNRAPTAIALLAYVWSLRNADGRITTSSYLPEGSNPSVLLPFLQMDRIKKFDAFWNTIFSGSKRLLTVDGGMYGDNTDIRAPAQDELSGGSFFGVSGSKRTGEAIKLALDGVFFVNGGFAGPNRLTSWEQAVAARAAYLSYATQARSASSSAAAQSDFFAQVQQLSGLAAGQSLSAPPLPRALSGPGTAEGIQQYYQRAIAQRVLMMRQRLGDAATLAAVGAWEDTPGPEPHRR